MIKETNKLNRKITNAKSPSIPFLSGFNYYSHPLIIRHLEYFSRYRVSTEIKMLSNRRHLND